MFWILFVILPRKSANSTGTSSGISANIILSAVCRFSYLPLLEWNEFQRRLTLKKPRIRFDITISVSRKRTAECDSHDEGVCSFVLFSRLPLMQRNNSRCAVIIYLAFWQGNLFDRRNKKSVITKTSGWEKKQRTRYQSRLRVKDHWPLK